MPLLDHFRPPLTRLPGWKSFHSLWAVAIATQLNTMLSPRYIAAVQTHLGTHVEADVAEFEVLPEPEETQPNGAAGGVAVQTWAPPVTTFVAPAVFPDDFGVQILDREEGVRLVAVVGLVSPGNKDRSESRRAFAVKCGAYLQRGIGLVAVDTVTTRQFNLHNELAGLLDWGQALRMPEAATLYAVAYRPARRQEKNEIDIWAVPLAVGGTLPLLPLALKGARAVPLDLEVTYTEARQRSRL
jgi:hypothetical protein